MKLFLCIPRGRSQWFSGGSGAVINHISPVAGQCGSGSLHHPHTDSPKDPNVKETQRWPGSLSSSQVRLSVGNKIFRHFRLRNITIDLENVSLWLLGVDLHFWKRCERWSRWRSMIDEQNNLITDLQQWLYFNFWIQIIASVNSVVTGYCWI